MTARCAVYRNAPDLEKQLAEARYAIDTARSVGDQTHRCNAELIEALELGHARLQRDDRRGALARKNAGGALEKDHPGRNDTEQLSTFSWLDVKGM
jgi:succinate dehydrogenase/fumarate reductase flavoprotein subunit